MCCSFCIATTNIAHGIVKFLALTGSRKQDAERFLSLPLADYMQRKGYKFEEKLIRTVANWQRACDERGLTELLRCKFNYQLLNLFLMPLHSKPGLYDFSLLEVTRYSIINRLTIHTITVIATYNELHSMFCVGTSIVFRVSLERL